MVVMPSTKQNAAVAIAAAYVSRELQPTLQRALEELARARPADPVTFLAHKLVELKPPPRKQRRLVIFSDRTPDLRDFSQAVKVRQAKYSFQDATAEDFVRMIERCLTDEGELFDSIALANHGPERSDSSGFCWALSRLVVLTDPEQLHDNTHPVSQVMAALGKAVVPGGRVDLFACSLLATPSGLRTLAAIESTTCTNFAASTNLTGNPKSGGDWLMESDGINVRNLYFAPAQLSQFEGTFHSSDKEHLSLVICGHVDSGAPRRLRHVSPRRLGRSPCVPPLVTRASIARTRAGKSTLAARLLFDLGDIPEREMQLLKAEAERLGKSSFAFAFYMDHLKEERERGVTISCTTKEFFTEKFHYTIIDAPGHRDFIKNMISGTAQADVGLLLVPADGNFVSSIQRGNHRLGEVQGQTRQHARLLNLLGVKQIAVGINKMHTDGAGMTAGGAGAERYQEISEGMKDMLKNVGWPRNFVDMRVPFLPLSGFYGDNLLKKSNNMDWWKGVDYVCGLGPDGCPRMVHADTLYNVLDKFALPERRFDDPMRMPVSGIYKIKGVGNVITGRVGQGTVCPESEVVFVPTHSDANPCTAKVFTIEMHHKRITQAGPGDNVGIHITGIYGNMPRRGDVMIKKGDRTITRCVEFTALIQILDIPNDLKPGYCPIGYVGTGRAACCIKEIHWKSGKETGFHERADNPHSLKSNDMGEVVFVPQQPLVVDSSEGLSRITFLEGNTTVMCGKVHSWKAEDGKVHRFTC